MLSMSQIVDHCADFRGYAECATQLGAQANVPFEIGLHVRNIVKEGRLKLRWRVQPDFF
jgi:hypothetical protein